jgi:hypothetical protein
MSANNQLTNLMQMMAEATGVIQKMQQCLPALIAAAAAETVAAMPAPAPSPAPKVKKAKKAAVVAPVEVVVAPVEAVVAPVEVVVAPVEAVAAVKVKKPASEGTMAWHAFVKHVKETQPSRFASFKKNSESLHEAKSIREEDEEGYKAFVSSWKAARMAETPAPAPVAEEVVVVAAPVAAPVAANAEVKEKEKEKEKRKAAVGTMAWHAFVTHCKATMPELADITLHTEKIKAISQRKDSDKAGYDSFVNEWKMAHPIMA